MIESLAHRCTNIDKKYIQGYLENLHIFWTVVKVLTYCRCVKSQNVSSCFDLLLEKYFAKNTIFIGESDFEDVRVIFDIFAADSQTCQSFFRTVLCFFEFPPCAISLANVSELLPICLKRCPEIQSAYQYCFDRLDLTIINNETYPPLRGLIENFNCTLPQTYYVNDAKQLIISNTSCSEFYKWSKYVQTVHNNCSICHIMCVGWLVGLDM